MDKKIFKKKLRRLHVFGRDASRLIWFLLCCLLLLSFIFILTSYFSDLISRAIFVVLLIFTGTLGSIAVFWIKMSLIVPYKSKRSLFRKFIRNEIYQELISSPYLIFEEQRDVLKYVESLLDKKNMIRLSTKQAELLALQNQINPHFLYNTLEAIRSDALCAGMNSIANTAEALATFFRYTISDMGSLVTVEAELDNIDNYFNIQQYRFGKKFTMNVDYSRCDDIMLLKLPKLTLQPLVENAIFHGLEPKAEGGCVSISIEVSENTLFISVRDNGVGISEEKLDNINYRLEHVAISGENESSQKKGGIALRNLACRIRLLFGENYGLHLYSFSGMGTEVIIKLPIIR